MTSMATRVDTLEGRLDSANEKMMEMMERHHRELATAREAETAKSQSEAEDDLERARQTIATLRERNTALLGEKETASKDVEALKKQAKGLSDEYGRLLMQKESLENKLADYELVFGDGDLKKSK